MVHEGDSAGGEVGADMERRFQIADLSYRDEVETIGTFLVADQRLGRPIDIEDYRQTFAFPILAAELGLTEHELEEAVAMSCARKRPEQYGDQT